MWTGSGFSGAFAQSLNWAFEDIITDTEQSGANHDIYVTPSGDIHVSYWQAGRDWLIYAFRDKSTGIWSTEIVDPSADFLGYKSAISVDDNGKVHIAYIANEQNLALLRYATNASGSWVTEAAFQQDDLGVYGLDEIFPYFTQASMDIQIQSSGLPAILFFNGGIDAQVNCGPPYFKNYSAYDLDMNIVTRQSDGSWQPYTFPNIPDKSNTACLPFGDRFGEFGQFFQGKNDRYYAFTNSFHNHELLLFQSDPSDLFSWNQYVIDSTKRVLNPVTSTHFRESFEFMDATTQDSSNLFMVYGVSEFYGQDVSTSNRKRTIFTHLNLDSLESSTYTPYHYTFSGLDNYRSYYTIETSDAGAVYLFYYSFDQGAVVMASSFDLGQTWLHDTVLNTITNTPLKSAIISDTLYLFTYRADRDHLVMSTKPLIGGNWNHEFATITEKRGTKISSKVVRQPGDDEIHLAFNEESTEQLFYARRASDTWTFETIEAAGTDIQGVSFELGEANAPCAAYVVASVEELRFACKPGSTWQIEVVDDTGNPRFPQLAYANNSIHICYYDAGAGQLNYASRNASGGAWSIEVVDSSSNIVGQNPSMIVDAGGTIHISYQDVWNSTIRYARKPAGGTWVSEEVTPPFNYTPINSIIKLTSNGLPIIAFKDGSLNRIFLIEGVAAGTWNISEVTIANPTNLIGTPLDLLIDEKDHPWVLFNSSSVLEEIRLVRRDPQNQWNEVSILNNGAEIANVFDFHLVDKDFYIIGKKNQLGNNGLALLYAVDGVTTALEADTRISGLEIVPNPLVRHTRISFNNPRPQSLSLGIYNLNGQLVHPILEAKTLPVGEHQFVWEKGDLAPGIYLCKLSASGVRLTQKMVVLP